MKSLRQIAHALGGEVRKEQVRAPGPGHSAHDRSMSVKLSAKNPDGFIVNSFAGDDPIVCRDYVKEKLGMTSTFQPSRKLNGHTDPAAVMRRVKKAMKAKTSVPKPLGTVTATYKYRNAAGEVIYEVQRLEWTDFPKEFRQRVPLPGGGYRWNVDGVTPVLYRLPELLQYPDASPIFVTEGEKDCDNLHSRGYVATTISGSAEWTPELAEPLRGRDIVILADNDEPGATKANNAAAALFGVANSVKIVLLPDLPPKGDVTNYFEAGHTQEQFDDEWRKASLYEGEPEPEPEPETDEVDHHLDKPVRFTLVSFDQIMWTGSGEHLVKDILPLTGLVLIYGKPKSGKSFKAFDLAMHVARGVEYRGKRIRAGDVVYLAAEGSHGFKKRIEAYRQKHDCDDARFHLCTVRPDLAADAATLIADTYAQLNGVVPALIVVDTVNRTLAGSESKDQDMAAYLRACAMLEDEFQCCICLVHHCGVEVGRPRGHTSLTAAADVQIVVTRDAMGHVVAEIELSKDGPSGEVFVSKLEPVDIGVNDDGEMETTCLVIPVEGMPAPKPEKRKLSDQATLVQRALAEAIVDRGEAHSVIPAGLKGVSVENWREECYARGIGGPEKEGMRQAFHRQKGALARLGIIGERDGIVWLAHPEKSF
jgi:hypothetical protein